MHGIGQLFFKNESFYFGDWKHGKAEGNGIMIYPNGEYYLGQFVANMAEGKGNAMKLTSWKAIRFLQESSISKTV